MLSDILYCTVRPKKVFSVVDIIIKQTDLQVGKDSAS